MPDATDAFDIDSYVLNSLPSSIVTVTRILLDKGFKLLTPSICNYFFLQNLSP